MNAWIIGCGLSGATCAYELRRLGFEVKAFEADSTWGGLSRSAVTDKGLIYEPHGSHIFHTDDEEVWNLANEMTPFWNYEHSVMTVTPRGNFTWPLQESEIREAFGNDAADALQDHSKSTVAARAEHGQMNFEEWCRSIMPYEVYENFVKEYTEKQWGCSASELSAEFAPKRVQVRKDGDKRLFKDRFQGFPDASQGGSYMQMHDNLWGGEPRRVINFQRFNLYALMGRLMWGNKPDLVVITAPLDDFCDNVMGPLSWRGLHFVAKSITMEPWQTYHQPTAVVNYPSKKTPFIRTHETKHMSRQDHPDTVIVTEFPGGPGRYYPVPDRAGKNRQLNQKYMEWIWDVLRPLGVRVVFCGRLASYAYMDQDDVMRQALDSMRIITDSGNFVIGHTEVLA